MIYQDFKCRFKAALWAFIVNNNIATDDEITLVTSINGYTEEALKDIIFARTGLRSYEQYKSEGFFMDDLTPYFEDEEEEEEDE